jgi:hypothetical protein
MAARLRSLIPDQRERRFDMRSLWRLGIWGVSATLALVVAVAAGSLDSGSRRPAATRGDLGAAQKGNAPVVPLASRLPEIDAETRRLSGAVRSLTDEREQLLARIGTLERNLEDVTGSIKRQQAAPAAAAPNAATPTPAPPAAAVAKAAVVPPDPQGADSAKPPARAAEPQPAAAAAPERLANAPAAPPPEEPPATGFGVDVGGAANFEGLRVLWNSTKTSNAAALEGMHPQVVVRENSKTKGAELRLIVGPIANVEEAARMCATARQAAATASRSPSRGRRCPIPIMCRPRSTKPRRRPSTSRRRPSPSLSTRPRGCCASSGDLLLPNDHLGLSGVGNRGTMRACNSFFPPRARPIGC